VNRCGNLIIVDFDIYVNDKYLSSYSADGVIVATATGSTAYSLSAGGPIIQPNAQLIMVTPICPHTLNKRSLIFGPNDKITIKLSDSKRTDANRIATFDGEQYFTVNTNDEIVITRSETITRLIKTNNDNFLSRVREKLM
jgi:NAD+ kinase